MPTKWRAHQFQYLGMHIEALSTHTRTSGGDKKMACRLGSALVPPCASLCHSSGAKRPAESELRPAHAAACCTKGRVAKQAQRLLVLLAWAQADAYAGIGPGRTNRPSQDTPRKSVDAWNTRPKPWLGTLIGGLPTDSVSDATVPTTCRTHTCLLQAGALLPARASVTCGPPAACLLA